MQPPVAEAVNPRATDEPRDRVADAAAERAPCGCDERRPMRRKKQRRDEEENRSGQGESPRCCHRANYQHGCPDINSQFRQILRRHHPAQAAPPVEQQEEQDEADRNERVQPLVSFRFAFRMQNCAGRL